ncbi:MAG TPA: VOC family protein [Gaiellaceae bacterium]|nr:VOC family protein [Gaiellaceae bacterium]
MLFHQGRLLDHVHLRVRDLEASKAFYTAALEAVGLPIVMEGPGFFAADELFVSSDGDPTSGLHLALQAADRETVHRFHEAVLAAGGRDNGAPGERSYHPGYYSAYALDPDGNNVEAVYHGPSKRSAASVEVEPA